MFHMITILGLRAKQKHPCYLLAYRLVCLRYIVLFLTWVSFSLFLYLQSFSLSPWLGERSLTPPPQSLNWICHPFFCFRRVSYLKSPAVLCYLLMVYCLEKAMATHSSTGSQWVAHDRAIELNWTEDSNSFGKGHNGLMVRWENL